MAVCRRQHGARKCERRCLQHQYKSTSTHMENRNKGAALSVLVDVLRVRSPSRSFQPLVATVWRAWLLPDALWRVLSGNTVRQDCER